MEMYLTGPLQWKEMSANDRMTLRAKYANQGQIPGGQPLQMHQNAIHPVRTRVLSHQRTGELVAAQTQLVFQSCDHLPTVPGAL